ncbi:hypothetical protein [Cryobacterium sp. Y11]|uniref:hypothetical protein n=1 Tax=Cryobacterium sp. Y11 TaxID=2045016 RepID=UPI000CE4E3D6|nr:hypothetical protein [Cryobacterium sp. Y11]
MIKNFTRAGIIGVIAAVALTGCQSGTPDVASPAAPASSTPTGSAPPADPLTTVTALLIGPENFELHDKSGTAVVTLSYDDPIDRVVDALTVALGADPVVAEDSGGDEYPPGVDYDWDGFGLRDHLPPDGKFPDYANFSVSVSAPVSGDVSVATTGGYRVGDDLRAAARALGVDVDTTFESYGSIFYFELGPELGTPSGGNTLYPNASAVRVAANSESGAIDEIASPTNPSFWVH